MNHELQPSILKFEFINPELDAEFAFSPITALNHQSLAKTSFMPQQQTYSSFNKMIDPLLCSSNTDPLDLNEIKIEPATLEIDYKSEIKVEEIDIKQEAYDVGDHNYVFVSKTDHSYAKRPQQKLQHSENSKDSIVDRNYTSVNFALSSENETELEIVAKNKSKIIELEVNKDLENSMLAGIQEIKVENDVDCDKTSDSVIRSEPETSQNFRENLDWQIDIKTLLTEMYLKESGIPVNKVLPVKSPELVPVVDLLNVSDSDTITASENASSVDEHEVSDLEIYKTKPICKELEVPEQRIDNTNKISEEVKAHKKSTKKTYKCNICNYRTIQKSVIKNHMKIHAGHKPFRTRIHTMENPYKCTVCSYSGRYIYHLVNHLKIHADVMPHVCKICGYRTKDEKSLIVHTKIHNGPLNCRLCGFTTPKTLIMENHMVKHARKKSYRCYQCDFVTWYDSELVLHKRSHLKEVQCEVCNTQMPGKAFEQHRQLHEVKCHECDFVAANEGVLMVHTANIHLGRTTFKCATCDYVTNTKNKLLFHMETHKKEKPYKCMKCGYAAMKSFDVRVHMRSHTNNIPYKCNKCSYTTPSTFNLLDHMDSHAEELLNSYEKSDEKCNASQFSPNKLQVYTITYDKEKNFKCNDSSGKLNKKSRKISNSNSVTVNELQDCTKTHDEKQNFTCNTGGIQESSHLALQKHLKIHTSGKFNSTHNYNLKICKRKSKQNRAAVKVSHKCRDCDYSSEDRIAMLRHMRMHMFEKPYRFKVYDCIGKIQSLMKRSTEKRRFMQKRFKCNGCEYSSVSEHILQRHVIKKHKRL